MPPTENKLWRDVLGVGGREGAFSMCTFWLVEALTRAGTYDKKYLDLATNVFENMLSFSNHLSMFSEEISRSGEQLGNTPQAWGMKWCEKDSIDMSDRWSSWEEEAENVKKWWNNDNLRTA